MDHFIDGSTPLSFARHYPSDFGKAERSFSKFDRPPTADPKCNCRIKTACPLDGECKQKSIVQGDPKRCVPIKISIVTLIKKLFISNYNHKLFSLRKTIHQSFSYFCQFLVNLWLSQDVFQMSTISLQANLYSSGKVVNHFYTLLFRDGSYFCCDGSFQFLNCL